MRIFSTKLGKLGQPMASHPQQSPLPLELYKKAPKLSKRNIHSSFYTKKNIIYIYLLFFLSFSWSLVLIRWPWSNSFKSLELLCCYDPVHARSFRLLRSPLHMCASSPPRVCCLHIKCLCSLRMWRGPPALLCPHQPDKPARMSKTPWAPVATNLFASLGRALHPLNMTLLPCLMLRDLGVWHNE